MNEYRKHLPIPGGGPGIFHPDAFNQPGLKGVQFVRNAPGRKNQSGSRAGKNAAATSMFSSVASPIGVLVRGLLWGDNA